MQKSNFLGLVAKERTRQIVEKGYTSEHDDKHTDGSLADAGAAYGAQSESFIFSDLEIGELLKKHYGHRMRSLYPFCPVFDSRQKHDKKTNLIIGAAFYMAEYERIVRLEEKGWTIKTRYSACGSTVGELIEALKNVPQDAVVKIPWPDYEDEQGMMFPVTGFTFNESSVDLQADED